MTHSWADDIVQRGLVVADLGEDLATIEKLSIALQQHDCRLIAFYGHGLEDSLLGQPNGMAGDSAIISVLSISRFPKELAGRKLYAVACLAGSRLGPALRSVDCEFIGYSEALAVPTLFENDCKAIINEGLLQWIRGSSTEAVCERLRDLWEGMALSFRQTGSKRHINLTVRSEAAAWAWFNRAAVYNNLS
jgi:hypothetical protein